METAEKFSNFAETTQLLTDQKQTKLYERLGELIRVAREKAEFKQESLADYLDLSRVSISNIEKGKQKIQIHSLLEVAKYLQTDITTFLSPLKEFLLDEVTDEEQKRISKGLGFPGIPDEFTDSKSETDSGAKVKEFVNFLKSKEQE